MLQAGLIQASKSPWCSPLLCIRKPDGKFFFHQHHNTTHLSFDGYQLHHHLQIPPSPYSYRKLAVHHQHMHYGMLNYQKRRQAGNWDRQHLTCLWPLMLVLFSIKCKLAYRTSSQLCKCEIGQCKLCTRKVTLETCHAFDFDHRQESTKIIMISRIYYLSKTEYEKHLKEEIPKCDLLCVNCHRVETIRRTKCL